MWGACHSLVTQTGVPQPPAGAGLVRSLATNCLIDIFITYVGIMVSGRILGKVSKIDTLEIGPIEEED